MFPLHTSASPAGASGPTGPRGPIRALLLTSLVLAAAAAVLAGAPGHLTLALAVAALGSAAVLGLRSRRVAAGPAPARDAVPTTVPGDTTGDLTTRLRRLYDDHVEQVNLALAEGREDLARELSDAYMDQALSLITTDAGVRP
jgi:hypothetical protein